MRNSKLVKAIGSLNAWELRHLSDFVHSPFFNKHEKVTALLDILIAAAPDFEEDLLDRKLIFMEIFQQQKFEEQKFKDLLSLGMKTFRAFLSFYRLRQDDFIQGLSLLEELSNRKWEPEFLKTLQQMEGIAQKQDGQMQEKALRQLRLQEISINFQGASSNRKADDSLEVAANLVDQFYLLARLKYAVEMVNRQNVIGQQYDLGLLTPILEYLNVNPEKWEAQAGVAIYLQIYKALIEPEEQQHFESLLKMMALHLGEFPVSERREIYGYALNFCIQKINRGQNQFLETLVTLYQNALDDETLLNDGWLSQWDYKNIVTAGLKARNFEWCSKFIEEYKAKIEPNARENAYTYNLASLHYEQGNYGQALRLLQSVEFTDVFYHLGAKVTLLKSYYETNDFETLHHLCETFRMYLKRNTGLSKYHYTINMNLISITRKLADMKSRWAGLGKNERVKLKEKLKSTIDSKGNVAQKVWLNEKLAELE